MILLALLIGCSSEAPAAFDESVDSPGPAGQIIPPEPTEPPPSPAASEDLVDPSIPLAVAGEGGWNYALRAEADLDRDGQPEQAILTAQVELYQGRPAWDDGQPWQVYVEEPDGTRTHVYARRLQLGTLAMRVALSDEGEPTGIVLIEHLPDRLSLYEIEYAGPGEFVTRVAFRSAVDPRGDTASPALP